MASCLQTKLSWRPRHLIGPTHRGRSPTLAPCLSFSSPQQASRNTKSRLNASSLCFLDVIYLPLWYLLTNSTAIASFVVSSPKPLSALVIPMFPDCCTVPGTKYILQTNLTCLTQAALLESVFLCTLLSRQIPAHHQVPA